MACLTLRLLGAPEAHHGGRPLVFSTRKTLALLIYLAVERGLHPRDRLVSLLWPASEAKQGRASLRRALAYLRETLNESDGLHLIAEGDTLGFDSASEIDLDLHVLEAASTAIRRLTGPAQAGLLSELQAAARLYRADFLDGFSLPDAPAFDDWASLQREAWHRRMETVFDRLSQLLSERGGLAEALDAAARWVAHNRLNEAAHRRLMQLHLANGNASAALQAYEACRALLAGELQVAPSPETEALAARIRQQSPAPGIKSRLPQPPSAPMEYPFVGRAGEHAHLVETYYTSARGQTRLVALEGEAGIGKTRLALEFLDWAVAQGADVLHGRAFELGSGLPYQPITQALRERLERENAPEDLLGDVWLAELSRLLPELRERYPDLPSPTPDESGARAQLFEAVARLGGALAQRTPLIVFIDDAHWADAASLDVLHYAARHWAESNCPILLLLSLRAEALATSPALSAWLANLKRDLPVTQVALGPLTETDSLRLVQSLAHAPEAARQFNHWLFAETGGQPLYLVETLKTLLERNLLTTRQADDGAWGIDFEAAVGGKTSMAIGAAMRYSLGIPPGVREIIRARLTRLSPLALTLLTAGAILGHEFSFDTLRQVAELDETEALTALDAAMASRLLVESDRVYSFAHDKIREVVYAEAGEARRGVFHRRALEALEAASAPAVDLARHALAAGLVQAAFRYSLAAGDEALRLFAARDAIAHYEQARALIANSRLSLTRDPTLLPSVQSLYSQLGRAYELISDIRQARSIYEAMLTLARDSQQPAAEWAALNHLATVMMLETFDPAHVLPNLQQALRVAEESGDRLGLVETEWNLAQVNQYAWNLEQSLTHGERALALARDLARPDLVARSLNALGWTTMWLGQWARAEACADESQALYAVIQNRAMESDCLCQAAGVRFNLGQVQAGIDAAHAAHVIAEAIDNPWGKVHSGILLALGFTERGEYSQALAFAHQAESAARAQSIPFLHVFTLMTLGSVYRALLSLEKAKAHHAEAWAICQSHGLPPYLSMPAALELCADHALVGDWAGASAYGRQTASDDFTLTRGGRSRWYKTLALVRAGEVEAAQEDARRWGERLGDSPRHRLTHLRALALLPPVSPGKGAKARGDLLREAAAIAESLGLLDELWRLYAALGETQKAAGIVRALARKIEEPELRDHFLTAAGAIAAKFE